MFYLGRERDVKVVLFLIVTKDSFFGNLKQFQLEDLKNLAEDIEEQAEERVLAHDDVSFRASVVVNTASLDWTVDCCAKWS